MTQANTNVVSEVKRRLPEDRLALILTFQSAQSNDSSPKEILANIFATYLFPQRGKILDVGLFTRTAQSVFGNDFSDLVAEVLIAILHQHGYLKREDQTLERATYRVSEEIEIKSADDESSLWDQFGEISRGFWEFFEVKAESLQVANEDKPDWEADLFLWLTSEDQSSREQLNQSVEKLISGKHLSESAFDSHEDEPVYSGIDRYRLFRFAQFVKYARRNEPALRDRIVAFAEAGFVFRVVRGFAAAPQIDTGDSDLTLVLDGPILIDALGLNGETRRVSTAKILELAAKAGIKTITLGHCVEEAVEIINTTLSKNSFERWGLAGDALRRNPSLKSKYRQFIQMPDKLLDKVGISILPFDLEAMPNSHGFFSKDLVDEFAAKAHFGGFNSTAIRRERDALSFAFVARRRGKTYKSDVFKSKFLLLTQNPTYASLSERFVQDYLARVPAFSAPFVVEISVLSALLWIRVSSDSSKTIPGLQLFATCQRLLASNKDVLKKAKEKLSSGLNDEDTEQLELLLGDPLAVEELVVRNAKTPVSASDPEDLRNAVKQAAIEEERRKTRQLTRKLKKDHKQVLSELTSAVEGAEASAHTSGELARLSDEKNSAVAEVERAKIVRIETDASFRFDILNMIVFLLGASIGVFGVLGLLDGLTPSIWFLAFPVGIIAVSAILRAPLLGNTIKKRYVEGAVKRRRAKLIGEIPIAWLKDQMRSEFLD